VCHPHLRPTTTRGENQFLLLRGTSRSICELLTGWPFISHGSLPPSCTPSKLFSWESQRERRADNKIEIKIFFQKNMIHTHTRKREVESQHTQTVTWPRNDLYNSIYILYTPGDRIQRYIIYLNFC
jgi:hypothetical protein